MAQSHAGLFPGEVPLEAKKPSRETVVARLRRGGAAATLIAEPKELDALAGQVFPDEPSPQNPLRFGGYELIERVGAGGMGEVFLAREVRGKEVRPCVIKKVLPNLQSKRAFVQRFLDEAKVAARLDHPNVTQVFAMGEAEGQCFISMEYIQGKTISRFSKRLRERKGRIPVGLALWLGEKVCAGLQHAHEATDEQGRLLQLVHRDLSPANICVSYSGDVKIIDFGAAQSTLKLEHTAPRIVIGNLAYMSPEQARKMPVDHRADIYSLGVVLWEILSGVVLSQKGDPLERWRKAAYPNWEAPSRHNPEVPHLADAVILKALQKTPDGRYRNAKEFGAKLKELRTKLFPTVGANELSALLSAVFEKEKAAEEAVLAQVMKPERREKPRPKAKVVPVTALAFEHDTLMNIGVPEVNLPPAGPEVTRRVFGMSFSGPLAPPELALAREIDPNPNDLSEKSSTPRLEWMPKWLREMVVKIRPAQRLPNPTATVIETRQPFGVTPRMWAAIGAGTFIAAAGAGYLMVWWAASW